MPVLGSIFKTIRDDNRGLFQYTTLLELYRSLPTELKDSSKFAKALEDSLYKVYKRKSKREPKSLPVYELLKADARTNFSICWAANYEKDQKRDGIFQFVEEKLNARKEKQDPSVVERDVQVIIRDRYPWKAEDQFDITLYVNCLSTQDLYAITWLLENKWSRPGHTKKSSLAPLMTFNPYFYIEDDIEPVQYYLSQEIRPQRFDTEIGSQMKFVVYLDRPGRLIICFANKEIRFGNICKRWGDSYLLKDHEGILRSSTTLTEFWDSDALFLEGEHQYTWSQLVNAWNAQGRERTLKVKTNMKLLKPLLPTPPASLPSVAVLPTVLQAENHSSELQNPTSHSSSTSRPGGQSNGFPFPRKWYSETFNPEFVESQIKGALSGIISDVIRDLSEKNLIPSIDQIQLDDEPNAVKKVSMLFCCLNRQPDQTCNAIVESLRRAICRANEHMARWMLKAPPTGPQSGAASRRGSLASLETSSAAEETLALGSGAGRQTSREHIIKVPSRAAFAANHDKNRTVTPAEFSRPNIPAQTIPRHPSAQGKQTDSPGAVRPPSPRPTTPPVELANPDAIPPTAATGPSSTGPTPPLIASHGEGHTGPKNYEEHAQTVQRVTGPLEVKKSNIPPSAPSNKPPSAGITAPPPTLQLQATQEAHVGTIHAAGQRTGSSADLEESDVLSRTPPSTSQRRPHTMKDNNIQVPVQRESITGKLETPNTPATSTLPTSSRQGWWEWGATQIQKVVKYAVDLSLVR
ncbi:hypothetical protein C8R45DRAFT_1209151 [Mycena sanguinolenta]|nr:hypothetical protein C8R45DRAFT_1209151 [Mycena sanguinolenta]